MKHQLELPLFEEWKTIENYEDYQVSNFGRVKSLKDEEERILKQSTNKYGYQQVKLSKNRKPKTLYVHRLVAMAFIDNPNNYEQVNHKDENKCNNHVDNLEWCNRKYNINYGTRNEKVSKALSGKNSLKTMLGKFGKEHPNSKQVIQLTLNGEVVKIWDSMHDVERTLGYYNNSICNCCKGKLKSAHGYKWKYA